MTPAMKRTLSLIFSALGVLFMLAMSFTVMPQRYALFAGVGCFVLSGMVWALPSGDEK
jgi:hypothetical protein